MAKRIGRLSIEDAIAISPSPRRSPGIEGLVDRNQTEWSDLRRQSLAKRAHHPFFIHVAGDLKAEYLLASMDSGIGSPRRHRQYRLSKNLREPLFDYPLDSPLSGLASEPPK
jgi:hypothetical protein